MAQTTKSISALEKARKFTTDQDLRDLFTDALGWGRPAQDEVVLNLGDHQQVVRPVAELQSFLIVEVPCVQRPLASEQKMIDRAVGVLRADRLTVFTYPGGQSWRWPKTTSSGSISQEVLEIGSGELPLLLAQRLAGLTFTAKDIISGLTLSAVRDRVRGEFDSSAVTKKFYDQFKVQHDALWASVAGIDNEQDRTSYTTLMLNRLMFLYFLQKKGFLNGDFDYLRNCLTQIRALNGKGKFYEFYRDCLLPMCFEGLNKADGSIHDKAISLIVGKVPYVNGGLFEQHEIESSSIISIGDDAFEEVFDFFDKFSWHLDTRPTGNPNEINPDVLGYIFEQYINFTSKGKKDNGAYYTKPDVTGYMVDSTLGIKVLEVLQNAGFDVLKMICENPVGFLPSTISHGFDNETKTWLPVEEGLLNCWLGDPIGWGRLDQTSTVDKVCLPGESWVEMFHRRERRASLISKAEMIVDLNELVTYNLDVRATINRAIESCGDPSILVKTWSQLVGLSILDPTCGSGAFLFAALELMEDAYLDILESLEPHMGQGVKGLDELVAQAHLHANARYFVRKLTALNNLFGTDIMEDAVETAKLRIFLALVACIDSIEELEPLPDLDFNLRCGNLLVGFADAEDASRVGGDIFTTNALEELKPDIEAFLKLYRGFVADSARQVHDMGIQKSMLRSSAVALRTRADRIYGECLGVKPEDLSTWVKRSRPFHWFLEFPHIVNGGGFSVIVGNPPYIAKSKVDNYDIIGYKTGGCPDVYAQCYERSLALLNSTGRHAFIVMLSLSFSDDYAALRRFISERKTAEWWSTFGKRPDALFSGIQVRNTILMLAPGSGQFVTSHNIFTSTARGHLFRSFEYFPTVRKESEIPLRAGIAGRIAEAMKSAPKPSASKKSANDFLFIRPTGAYWFPALFQNIPILDDSFNVVENPDPRTIAAPLAHDETLNIAAAICAGKLGYLWWSATADDFDVALKDSLPPRGIARTVSIDQGLEEAAKAVRDAAVTGVFASLNAKKMYMNIRWSDVRNVTDLFDRMMLGKLGLMDEWRNLNIWYRQVMKSGGENSNSIEVPMEIARRYF